MIFKQSFLLATLLILSACAGGTKLISQEKISQASEKQWTDLLEKMEISQNKLAIERASRVTKKILTAADENPDEWEVVVFENDDIVNAFALPNKKVGIFTAILAQAENDDQLAVIIGHEVAHIRLSHAEARVNRQIAPGILIGVATLPGEIVDVGAVKTAGAIVGTGVAAGTILPFNRRQELEADLEGLRYLVAADYNPKEAPAFWRNLATGKEKTTNIPEFLSTHPGDERRIKALEAATDAL